MTVDLKHTVELIALNIASIATLIGVPRIDMPTVEHWVEFGLKCTVMLSVISLNVYKIRQSRRNKQKP